MTEYRTTDTDELAPYPDMTSDDLHDFEVWTDEVENNGVGLTSALVYGGLLWAIIAVALWLGTAS